MGHSNRNEEGTEDEPGMKDSLKDLDSLIDHELSLGVDVLVGGFSQGAGLSLLAGLTEGRAEKLKGLILLSGYLPLKWKILDVSFSTFFLFERGLWNTDLFLLDER